MTTGNTTPPRLIAKLVIYFGLILVVIASTIIYAPDALDYLPFGGRDALERGDGIDIEVTQSRLSVASGGGAPGASADGADTLYRAMLFLGATLLSTLIVMLPITWTYSATRFDAGPSKTFVRALLVLPICATTVVLLIQDSLALAFGLAALVAAVRFRVALDDSIDGIYIFAAICVGLAAGIGYLGVATIMAMFFCLTNSIVWQLDYGRNPIDEARRLKKRAKLEKT